MNWTFITAYFDLTKYPDINPEIQKRDMEYYLSHAQQTLEIPYNLVIYCEEENLDRIQQVRRTVDPDDLKTVYKTTTLDSFDDGKFSSYRDKITENRKKNSYNFCSRNCPSYYLLCMSRYLMLKEVINLNPFESTHFGWINFCISRMGSGAKYLYEVVETNRDKFSTCFIDYIPKQLVYDTKEFFRWGRCGLACSGFFTGNAEYMMKFCDLIYEKFLYYMNLGYGHADEQLYNSVYYENKDIFEPYFGDYTEMITNYKYIRERPEEPLRNVIKNSFCCGDYSLCLLACNALMESLFIHKTCVLNDQNRALLFYYNNTSMSKILAQ